MSIVLLFRNILGVDDKCRSLVRKSSTFCWRSTPCCTLNQYGNADRVVVLIIRDGVEFADTDSISAETEIVGVCVISGIVVSMVEVTKDISGAVADVVDVADVIDVDVDCGDVNIEAANVSVDLCIIVVGVAVSATIALVAVDAVTGEGADAVVVEVPVSVDEMFRLVLVLVIRDIVTFYNAKYFVIYYI